MPSAWNACIAWTNLADAGVVTASSATVLTPPSLLQNPHVARHWRSLTGAAYVVADLGAVHDLDTVAVMGTTLSAAGLTRVRASATDPSALDGAAYDSDPAGAAAGRIDPRYAMFVHLMPAPVSARYVRVDLAEPGAAYVEAGRLFVGPRHQFARNFDFGWSRAWVDRSRKTEGRGGQLFIDPDRSYRTIDLQFAYLSEAERWAAVEEIDRVNGEHVDQLLVTDPTSTNLGRDSLWGLLDGNGPVQQPAAWIDETPVYSKSYRIRERL